MSWKILLLVCLALPVLVQAATEEEKAGFKNYLKVKRLEGAQTDNRKQLRANYFEREALAGAIESEGTLNTDLIRAEVREFEKDVLIQRYFETFLKNAVPRSVARDYYRANKNLYRYDQIKVAHILFRVKDGAKEDQKKAVRKRAKKALNKIIDEGADFTEVAREFSEDRRTKLKGGELGWVRKGFVDDSFSKKLFKLNTESGPTLLKSDWGFHIVLVQQDAERIVQTFKEVSGAITQTLRDQAKAAEIERLKSL